MLEIHDWLIAILLHDFGIFRSCAISLPAATSTYHLWIINCKLSAVVYQQLDLPLLLVMSTLLQSTINHCRPISFNHLLDMIYIACYHYPIDLVVDL